ncbi:unnamed protein product [Candida verbasci]|uniref:Phosphoglycerate mutase n=1 Tax=Candida verbasci TaxID=1227364 RepID=A0A9W4TUX8_9ASCO|nr:unnamed protein product [Candida verbasci]
MTLPNERDRFDAHGDLDEDEKYYQVLNEHTNVYPEKFRWKFSSMDGFFEQSDPQTNDMMFNYLTEDFGILKPWPEIVSTLNELNKSSSNNVSYKLIFFSRHGQAMNNIASARFSKDEWFNKWRYLGTDGEIIWGPDSELSDLGKQQALENHKQWKYQLIENQAPFPQNFYSSPLTRPIETHNIIWDSHKVEIIENLRETIGLHLCHKRSRKSELLERYPNIIINSDFNSDFTEEDLLFDKYLPRKEFLHEQFLRINKVLQQIFDYDNNEIINITSHAGTIRSFITVVGHRKFTIPTGGIIPILIKGEKL